MVVDNEEEPMEGVPLEQYRAWLGEKTVEVAKLGCSFLTSKRKRVGSENFQCTRTNFDKLMFALSFNFPTQMKTVICPPPHFGTCQGIWRARRKRRNRDG
jgi:hypothetical protein